MDFLVQVLNLFASPAANTTIATDGTETTAPLTHDSPWPWFVTWSLETVGISFLVGIVLYGLYWLIKKGLSKIFAQIPRGQKDVVARKKLDKVIQRMTQFNAEFGGFRQFRDLVQDESIQIYELIDEITTEIASLLVRISDQLSNNIEECKAHASRDLTEKFNILKGNLNRIDKECNFSQIQLTESISGLQEQIDDLHASVSPTPVPVLSSILGPQYPISAPASDSVKNYVDKKLDSITTGIDHYRRSTAARMDDTCDKMRAEINTLRGEIEAVKKQSMYPPPQNFTQLSSPSTTPTTPIIISAPDTISPLPSTTTTYNGMPSLVDESAAQPPLRRSTRSTRRPARYGPLRPNSQQDPPSSQHRQMPLLTPYTARD
ncbi:Interferon-induced GTP-binding protein Mx1 [Folsomia candida]|uniref:Interferon-induced GTP-binding protein Mx1 n=1 Tax=Folsomia candida TaxID=158441 RepID=A0A226DE48_FOLCA|nr:Interferon-induced GTP-binding protein Mx1 [Folsomia candida]